MTTQVNSKNIRTYIFTCLGICTLVFAFNVPSLNAQSESALINRVNQALREANLPVTPANQQQFAALVAKGEITNYANLVATMKQESVARSLVQRVNEALRTTGVTVNSLMQQKYAALVITGRVTTFHELVSEIRKRENLTEARPLITLVNQALRTAGLPVTAELQQRFAARVASKEITTYNQLVASMRGEETELPLITVNSYFSNSNKLQSSQNDCTTVYKTERFTPRTSGVARAALQQLLAGVTNAEKEAGYTTSIPSGVNIQKLTISNGVARVDFNKALDQNVGGSCRVAAIRAQITSTLKQFSTVNSVIISINGETESILQP